MEYKEDEIIEITDEDGEISKVQLIDIVVVDDIEYAILSPVDVEEEDDDEYVLMRIRKEGEDYSFETIDDDDEFDKVAAYIDEIADDIED